MNRLLLLAFVILIAKPNSARSEQFGIEGYCGKVSYAPGETLTVHASTETPQFSLEIVRVGANRETVFSQSGLAGKSSPIPENASSHGCNWPALHSMVIPDSWKSGFYEIILRIADGGGKYVGRNRRTAESSCYFILRTKTAGSQSKILLQLSTNTYNAYNNWGGFSLYAYNGQAGVQGNRVSFLRPPQSQYPLWELPMVAWCESNKIPIEFAANNDLEFLPENLKAYSLVLSVGHDEYWSSKMRDNLEQYISDGGNVAFFSGNTCCWQIRNEDQGNSQVSWKQRLVMDPIYPTADHRLLSTLWSHHLVGRPENQLTGVGFLWGGYHRSHEQLMDGSGGYTVHRPDHWLFEGTNLKKDDLLGAKDTVVGYECDGCEMTWKDGLPYPTHRDGTPEGFEILATAPAQWHPDDAHFYDRFEKGRKGASVIGIYQRGGTVVTVGSTDWSHGLRGNDPQIVAVTQNIIKRLSKGR